METHNRIARYFPEPSNRNPASRDDDLQAAYLSGYADSESRYSVDRIRAVVCFISLISGLSGFLVGILIARLP